MNDKEVVHRESGTSAGGLHSNVIFKNDYNAVYSIRQVKIYKILQNLLQNFPADLDSFLFVIFSSFQNDILQHFLKNRLILKDF